jgi:hypothetical protein
MNLFSSGAITFNTNAGSEIARFSTAGYLGIGTSAPTSKLTVNGTAAFGGVYQTTPAVLIGNNGSVGYVQSIDAAGTANYPLAFFGASEYARFDTSGNLGLGVTPSAWGSSYRAFNIQQFGSRTAALYGGGGVTGIGLTMGVYNDNTNFIYSVTGAPVGGYLINGNGNHLWFTGSSGTAGTTCTFTQAMTLDNSGQLGIGVTSPSAVLHTSSGAVTNSLFATTRASGAFIRYDLGASGATIGYAGSAGQLTSGATADFVVRAESNLVFGSGGGTERMRIDSSGNLLVGTTTTGITTTGIRLLYSTSTSPIVATTGSSTSSGDQSFISYSTGAGAYRFYVDMAGTIHATSIVITAISDQRLKENIRDLDVGLSTVMALKPRRFDWKEGKGQDKKNAAGFIAQEFQEVLPNSISTYKAGGDGIEYLTMNHEELIPTLVKAIQEQQAIIEQLKAKVGI